MPKKQDGQLFMKEGRGWYGRFYATVEGERVRVCRALNTQNKAIARRKLARLIAEGNVAPEEAQRAETFEEAARRVVDAQRDAGMVTWKDRLYRLTAHAFPALGKMLPAQLKAVHVRDVLTEARDGGMAHETLKHLRGDVSKVLDDLWRAEELPENVVDRVEVPEALPSAVAEAKKERAVLEDDELVRYLAWEPSTAGRPPLPESQSGSGRMDFMFAATLGSGEPVTVCAEFKVAHSKDLAHGLESQLLAYMDEKGRTSASSV